MGALCQYILITNHIIIAEFSKEVQNWNPSSNENDGSVKYVFGKYFKKLKWDSFLQDLRGFIYFNFYWSIVAFNVVLVSSVQQGKSAIDIHISSFLYFFPI